MIKITQFGQEVRKRSMQLVPILVTMAKYCLNNNDSNPGAFLSQRVKTCSAGDHTSVRYSKK